MVSLPGTKAAALPDAVMKTLPVRDAHVPPVVEATYSAVSPSQRLVGPAIVALTASGVSIKIVVVLEPVPQILVRLYEMITVPTLTPVTTPALDTTALVLDALQVPPDTEAESVAVLPAHNTTGPVMVPVTGVLSTVIKAVDDALPHTLVTVYTTLAVPVVRACTKPADETEATVPLVVLQLPPDTVEVSVAEVPTQRVVVPLSVPAKGSAFTVNAAVRVVVPQLFVAV
jgi:hypothetical protein